MNNRIETLAKRPKLKEQTIAMVERSLGYSKGNSFATDFAPLVDANNLHNCYVLYDSQSEIVLAHVGVCPKTFVGKDYSFQVAFLGGIATHPDYRGRGHFKKLFSYVLNKYQEETSLFWLWSDLQDLYHGFNFHLAFGQHQICSDKNAASSFFEQTQYHLLSDQDKKELQHLYRDYCLTKFVSPLRTESDWKCIEKIKSAQLYLYRDKNMKILAYYFQGKGQDLSQIVHELAYRAEAEEQITKELKGKTVWLPEEHQNLEPSRLNFMALVRIGGEDQFKKLISDWSRGKVNIIEVNEENVTFDFDKTYKYSHGDFLNIFFGPRPVQEFASFERPVFISGLDSI